MGKILNMLYAGDLHPADCVMQDSAEYQAMCRESLKEVERFTEKLDAGMKAEFDYPDGALSGAYLSGKV